MHQKNLQVYKIAIFAATQRLKLQIVGFAPRSDEVHSSAVCGLVKHVAAVELEQDKEN